MQPAQRLIDDLIQGASANWLGRQAQDIVDPRTMPMPKARKALEFIQQEGVDIPGLGMDYRPGLQQIIDTPTMSDLWDETVEMAGDAAIRKARAGQVMTPLDRAEVEANIRNRVSEDLFDYVAGYQNPLPSGNPLPPHGLTEDVASFDEIALSLDRGTPQIPPIARGEVTPNQQQAPAPISARPRRRNLVEPIPQHFEPIIVQPQDIPVAAVLDRPIPSNVIGEGTGKVIKSTPATAVNPREIEIAEIESSTLPSSVKEQIAASTPGKMNDPLPEGQMKFFMGDRSLSEVPKEKQEAAQKSFNQLRHQVAEVLKSRGVTQNNPVSKEAMRQLDSVVATGSLPPDAQSPLFGGLQDPQVQRWVQDGRIVPENSEDFLARASAIDASSQSPSTQAISEPTSSPQLEELPSIETARQVQQQADVSPDAQSLLRRGITFAQKNPYTVGAGALAGGYAISQAMANKAAEEERQRQEAMLHLTGGSVYGGYN